MTSGLKLSISSLQEVILGKTPKTHHKTNIFIYKYFISITYFHSFLLSTELTYETIANIAITAPIITLANSQNVTEEISCVLG